LPDGFSSSNLDTRIEVAVLTAVQYEKLEKQLAPPAVTTNTTDLLAGYQLGVQDVLRKLRQGYVVS
jgi:hypothetical protein